MSSPVRYVVRRQEYAPPNSAGVRRVLPEKWSVAATFAKPADAHAEHAKHLTAVRRTLNPFTLGGPNLFYQTSLPAYALHDYLLDHGLTPPPTATTSSPNYVFWWVKHNRTFTDAERAAVWQACDKLRLFDVIEVDDRTAAWVVVENDWLEQHNSFNAEYNFDPPFRSQVAERYQVREAHPSRRAAERAKASREAAHREENEREELTYFDATGQSHEWATAPFFSTLKVSGAGGYGAAGVFVVGRRRYADELSLLPRRDVWEQLGYADEREPLFAFADGETADAHARELTRVACRTANPFALVGTDFFRPPLSTHSIDDNAPDELPNGLSLDDALAAVMRLDTTPPPPAELGQFAAWYDQLVQWSPEFVDIIWGTFADFRLFEVAEVPLG